MNSFQPRAILGNGFAQAPKNEQKKTDAKPFNFLCKVAANGKIAEKEEHTPFGKAVYQYSYDSKGHLTSVKRNGKLIESYTYNQEGQRIEDHRASFGGSRQFIYSYDRALIRINDAYLDWTPLGQLKAIYAQNERAEYEYGDDTRLDKVFLPSGSVIQYEYENELMPVRVLEGYEPVLEYSWKNALQLHKCVDIQNEVTYVFSYGKTRTPESVTVQGQPQAIQSLTGQFTSNLKVRIWTDQIGSIRALSSESGTILKYLEYDAFGNIALDTKPSWNFPLGFAGGLNDVYTGFVRFGFRDYDPQVGRFTAKDPIGDTGGDHDLWDYCVDDPVSCIDPSGLKKKDVKEDKNKSKNKEYSFWEKYIIPPLWLDHDNPRYESAVKSLNRSLVKFGTGHVEFFREYPSVNGIIIKHIPGYQEHPVGEEWNKDGTRKKK